MILHIIGGRFKNTFTLQIYCELKKVLLIRGGSMKKILLLSLAFLFLLFGCKKDIYDKEYGVSYSLNNDCFIRIYLDPNDSRLVSALYIVADKDNRQGGFDTSLFPSDVDEDTPISYDYTDSQEMIYFRFYNKDFDYDKAASLFEYVGLDSFKNRPYLKDIVKSNGFRYQNIVLNGELCTDLSFTGQGKTVDMEKALK